MAFRNATLLAGHDRIAMITDIIYGSSTMSLDASPKWFTEIELDLNDHWTESTIEYVPRFHHDDSLFTRVELADVPPALTPASILGA